MDVKDKSGKKQRGFSALRWWQLILLMVIALAGGVLKIAGSPAGGAGSDAQLGGAVLAHLLVTATSFPYCVAYLAGQFSRRSRKVFLLTLWLIAALVLMMQVAGVARAEEGPAIPVRVLK